MDNELHIKYQKLAQEYQKLRAQVSVLKKGVIDEQTNSKSLQELVKQKDQVVRKYEQEIDSLQFRNDQLSKRVEILQGDLDAWERGNGKPKPAQDYRQNEVGRSVHAQELEMKIKENEGLHEQLHDANEQHHRIVKELEGRIESYERTAAGHNKSIEETNARYNRVIERLQEDRALLEGRIRKQEEELKIANIMIDKYQKQMKGNQNDLRTKLEKANHLLKGKIPFHDTEKENLNLLNVPVCDKGHQLQTRFLVDQFTSLFIQFMSSLSDYHTYLEQASRCVFLFQ
ncbi:protein phosphatase 1 regulatory subunit 21-like [Rhopilema esculentum]|uniref:protein phosphatase 1 regulatory subunit 21-like n=1 Tax=Rhopilema esculentum TaxID=499914 RepID=UPI0031CDF130